MNAIIAAQLASDEPDYERRFGGVARLYGSAALARFASARVCVIGIGGVGSWTVEALARSGLGHLTLIDLDHVAESNINRQIHATGQTLGAAKVMVMRARIAEINPRCEVAVVEEFIEPGNLSELIGAGNFDFVIDAIDSVVAKVALIAYCREHAIRLLTIGSAGGQRDATRVRVCDLSQTEHEPLLARVRKRLRQEHGFPRNIKQRFGIDAVFSEEPLSYPRDLVVAGDDCAIDQGTGQTGLNCAGLGSSVAVTAVFGFAAAGHVLNALAAAA